MSIQNFKIHKNEAFYLLFLMVFPDGSACASMQKTMQERHCTILCRFGLRLIGRGAMRRNAKKTVANAEVVIRICDSHTAFIGQAGEHLLTKTATLAAGLHTDTESRTPASGG